MLENRLKVLVIGYGSIGRRHIDNLSSFPNMELIVCTNRGYDNFLKKRRCVVYNSLEKCISQKPTIAIISNITSLHTETAIKLANADINLFIEKPLSHSMLSVKSLANVVRIKRLVTLMGCNLRFHPCIKKIKELIDGGDIGRVISVRAENGSYLPQWHPYEDYKQSYAAKKEWGGGVALTSIHEIDYLYWFFGNMEEIFSITGKFSDLTLSADDLSVMLMRFKNGVIAEIHLDYFQRPDYRGCKIIGTKGSIYWDSNTNAVRLYDVKKKKWIEKLKLKDYDNNLTYIEEMRHLINCVNKKKKTINTIHDGIKTLQIVLAAKQASRTGKMVKLR